MYKSSTRLAAVLAEHPHAAGYLASVNPRLKLLGNPVIVGLMAARTDLNAVAERGGWTLEELEDAIMNSDAQQTGPPVPSADTAALKESVKDVLRKLYAGEDPESCKVRFKELIAKTDPLLLATAEAELAREGFSPDQLLQSCDVHMDVFRHQLADPRVTVPDGHPLRRFIDEQDVIIGWLEDGVVTTRALVNLSGYSAAETTITRLRRLMQRLHEAQSHDIRQENTLFPLLERYGVEEPPAIMWAEHDRMKSIRDLIDTTIAGAPYALTYPLFAQVLAGAFQSWREMFAQHARKEQEILYNVALELLSEQDWHMFQQESEKLGFFTLPGEGSR